MEDRKKTYVADIERGVYDIKDEMKHKFTTEKGLTEEIERTISEASSVIDSYTTYLYALL